MGSAALRPSHAVARLLRTRRKELRLTLREVSERVERKGERIPPSTLARIEQGKLDPGVRRLHMLLALYHVPPHLVADLVELETLAVEAPPEKDLQALYERGLEHWKSGDISRGLAYLFAVREYVPEGAEARVLRQKATLSFAVIARNLGKFRLAKQVVDDLLCEPPDPSVMVRVLVLASSVWRGLGGREVALALVRQARADLQSEESEEATWVLHQEAKLLVETGEARKAQRALARVLKLYRSAGDTYGEVRALTLRIAALEGTGHIEEALRCARDVIRRADRHGHSRVAVAGHLELGRLLVASGLAEEGVEVLGRGLARAALLADRAAEFVAHHHLWQAHRILGDEVRAAFELKAAGYFLRFVDDVSPEADAVRAALEEKKK